MIPVETIRRSVLDQRDLVESLFRELAEGSADTQGVTRDTYGRGENFAHALFARRSAAMGLDVSTDIAGNTYATWQGSDRSLPRVLIGSHLDSVRQGGNFDGAAGVVAGLASVAALRSIGLQPRCDIQTMGVRAEESAWFQVSYIGSRSALGRLPDGALNARRVDTGKSLFEYIAECGGDPTAIEQGVRSIDPASVRAFIEVHIEQAPSLIEAELPIAICTAIPGNFRYSHVKVHGEHGHVGLPRRFRRDSVMAAVDFAHELDRLWESYESAGQSMACTLGRFHTDPAFHGLTNVPGLFHFSLDVRAYDEDQLKKVEREVLEIVSRIERKRSVKFDMGVRASAAVGVADAQIRRGLVDGAAALGIPSMLLGSPGSHDSAAFAESGVPMGMIFVRNANGSHNPREAMEIDDFLDAVSVLSLWLAENACAPVPARGR